MKAPWKNLTQLIIFWNNKLTKDYYKLFAKCKWPKLAIVKHSHEAQDYFLMQLWKCNFDKF